MRQLKAKIIENKKITQGFYRMRLNSSYLAHNAKPGQFVEVKCSDKNEILLRRPLGVHRILNNGIEILYEVVGKGTELLSKRKAGEGLDIIGPLGTGFVVSSSTKSAILVAGGIGVAPLVALAQDLRKKKNKVAVVIGAKTKSHILCEGEFKSLGCMVSIATEDGSKGRKGLATDLLKYFLRTTQYALVRSEAEPPRRGRSTFYACGPAPMLKTVAQIAEKRRISCQVSLEERMACGVGVCLGCPVKVKTQYGYKMVCKDGPVFDAKEITW